MLSGYERSPDYGGPEPTQRGVVLAILAFAAAVIAVVLFASGWF